MTRPILYTLTSGLHDGMLSDARQEPFIQGIEAALGAEFNCRGEDFHDYGGTDREFIYVRTGGTEGLFLRKVVPALSAGKKVRLLTSGLSNSLAASMEILSWLRQQGYAGEILHGGADSIAGRIGAGLDEGTDAGTLTEPLTPGTFGRILEGKRFGVIGKPSDWLISSGVDYAAARENLGAELIDIPIEELVLEARRQASAPSLSCSGTPLKELNLPRYGRKIDAQDWKGALAICEALRRLVIIYRLDGLTLRCFDLLPTLHNTGCLGLAVLNAEGITATCEGDIPAMLSMAVARELSGSASFQVNLSRIEGDRLLFAHCTVPLSIVRDYSYDTHFESGIGVAIHGELPEGPVTLFKISPDFRRMFRREARLTANTYGDRLCRTQVVVEAPGAAEYFLRQPIGNHHILVPGKL
ncbi:MAG: hypothetical protein K5910_03025 [Bacteroidales bacterium]|nr:hypothetical protein [Bacteroidales bacterium]